MHTRLSQDQWAIWTAGQNLLPFPRDQVWTECPIKHLHQLPLKDDRTMEEVFEDICCLRCDVIVWSAGKPYLVEVETRLNTWVVGQTVCHEKLWQQINPTNPFKKVFLMVAEDDPRIHPAIDALAYELTIVTASIAG